MKQIIYLIVFLFVLISCKKEEIKPNVVTPTEEVPQEIRLYGKWLLVGGSLYLENLETHEKTKYDHFGPGKTTSSLDLDGSDLEIEDIELDVTTWAFYQPYTVPGYGEFVLNNDTIQPYGFYVTKHNWSIVEHPQSTQSNMQLGGSSRPISAVICNMADTTVYFYIQEEYTSINNMNYRYISELKFKKIESW
jgi:hypothetical protein